VLWMYHGHSAESADTYAGLVGPIIISNKGVTDKALGIDRCFSINQTDQTLNTKRLPTAPTPPSRYGFVASMEQSSKERTLRSKPCLKCTPQARAA